MATFHLELDKRVKLKNDRYNLCVRIGMGNDNIYLKYVPVAAFIDRPDHIAPAKCAYLYLSIGHRISSGLVWSICAGEGWSGSRLLQCGKKIVKYLFIIALLKKEMLLSSNIENLSENRKFGENV
ncbi:MAG: hypothetical protein GYA51_15310 [Candidatus Methanofastidiosa archaeon]|nr:hypothetical protein [Candidatus Methanofastidiosa archaeon]